MKNAFSPTTHLAAALLGAAMATTLLTKEPLGLSLTPRMEIYNRGRRMLAAWPLLVPCRGARLGPPRPISEFSGRLRFPLFFLQA